jgi:hypothetical protein
MASVSVILRRQLLQVGVFYPCQPEILAGLSHQRCPLFAAEVKQDYCNSTVFVLRPETPKAIWPMEKRAGLSM